MTVHHENLTKIIQFTLLCAGEEEDYADRSLGKIHFIKYVYLADLAYAKKHNGQTYTGIEWQFYKFGPWSQVVNENIEQSLQAINVNKTVLESNFTNEDCFRWSHSNNDLLTRVSGLLPLEVYMLLKKMVRMFTNNTYDLLDFVYKTPPMLSAKPNELLKFDVASEKRTPKEKSMYESLSNKKKSKLKEKLLAFKDTLKKKNNDSSTFVNPFSEDKFDSIYFQGLDWLDEIAGNKTPSGEIDLIFNDDVWLSNTRKDIE